VQAPRLEAACEDATWALKVCQRWLKAMVKSIEKEED